MNVLKDEIQDEYGSLEIFFEEEKITRGVYNQVVNKTSKSFARQKDKNGKFHESASSKAYKRMKKLGFIGIEEVA